MIEKMALVINKGACQKTAQQALSFGAPHIPALPMPYCFLIRFSCFSLRLLFFYFEVFLPVWRVSSPSASPYWDSLSLSSKYCDSSPSLRITLSALFCTILDWSKIDSYVYGEIVKTSTSPLGFEQSSSGTTILLSRSSSSDPSKLRLLLRFLFLCYRDDLLTGCRPVLVSLVSCSSI